MKWAKSSLRTAIAGLVWTTLLLTGQAGRSQTATYDLAHDWSLTGAPFKGMPFGPDYAWSVCAVPLQPDGKWEAFDRAMHFTISNPWFDVYGIDGWWLGSSPVARKPMAGKNIGPGNVPGRVHGVNYDWPIGRVAAFTWPDPDQVTAKRMITAIVWTAPTALEVSVSGGVWMAGQYEDAGEHRSRVTMWMHPASARGGLADTVIFEDFEVPLWTEGYDSGHPQAFSQILGNQTSRLQRLRVVKGDRIAVGFYRDGGASKPTLNGIDFSVMVVR